MVLMAQPALKAQQVPVIQALKARLALTEQQALMVWMV
jgi:hypothetical protein